MAEERDKELLKLRDKVGKIHGIPISVKDHVRFIMNEFYIDLRGR